MVLILACLLATIVQAAVKFHSTFDTRLYILLVLVARRCLILLFYQAFLVAPAAILRTSPVTLRVTVKSKLKKVILVFRD